MSIFKTSQPVTGENFIGRKEELELLSGYLNPEDTASLSITGLNRIGKTSLILEGLRRVEGEEIPDLLHTKIARSGDYTKVYIYREDFRTLCGSTNERFISWFLSSVALPLRDLIIADKITVQSTAWIGNIIDKLSAIAEKPELKNEDIEAADGAFTALFDALYRKENIIVSLAIDEFDEAIDANWSRRFMALRTWVCTGGLQLITVSRLTLGIIEEVNQIEKGSSLTGVLGRMPLFGFSNSELDEFFARLEKASPIPIDETIKKDNWYYCGRCPFFLSSAADLIIRHKAWHPGQLEVAISEAVEKMDRILEREKVLDQMVHIFCARVVPNGTENKLIGRGFAAKISEYAHPEEYYDYLSRDEEDTGRLITVCQYYVDHLAERHYNIVLLVNRHLSGLQLYMRGIIYFMWHQQKGDEADAELKKELGKKERIRTMAESTFHLYRSMYSETKRGVNPGWNYLSACSFVDYPRLMGPASPNQEPQYWKEYSVFFPTANYRVFAEDCDSFNLARNPDAHKDIRLATAWAEKVEKKSAAYLNHIRTTLEKKYPEFFDTWYYKEEIEPGLKTWMR